MTISRMSSRAPLQESLLPLRTPNEKPHHSLYIVVAVALHPRRSRQLATCLGLLFLILLTAYTLLVHCSGIRTSLVLWDQEAKPSSSQFSLALESLRKSNVVATSRLVENTEKVRLTDAQELAGISSFLASLPQNRIPSYVDPSRPVDPQLVLDFDTRSPRASQEVREMVDDVWSRNPVFLYSKRYSSASREVKAILNDLNLQPSPTIIDVDLRDDADVLIPILHRLTSNNELPILIIAGKPVGTVQDIRKMHRNGTLRQIIMQSGALIDGVKKKKQKH